MINNIHSNNLEPAKAASKSGVEFTFHRPIAFNITITHRKIGGLEKGVPLSVLANAFLATQNTMSLTGATNAFLIHNS